MSCIIEIKSTDSSQLDRIENILKTVVERLQSLEAKMSDLDNALIELESAVNAETEQGKLTVAELAELKETVVTLQAAVEQLQQEIADGNAPAIAKIGELTAKIAGILPD